MGWTWRRSTSVGPFRFNFSPSGVGMSVGVRGARISMGPRGTYVHVGAGGFRYSQRIDGPAPASRAGPSPRPVATAQVPALPPGRTVEVLEPAELMDCSADELLEEIRRKEQKTGLTPFAIGTSAIGFVAFLLLLNTPAAPALRWIALTAGVLGLVALPWAQWSDRRARRVRIHYIFDPLGEKVQEGLERLFAALERVHAIWAVHHEHVHGDWKRNAGAGTSVGRRRIRIGWGPPPFIQTNARVGLLSIEGTRLYFFPDRLLIFGRGGVAAVRYTDLKLEASAVQFIEEGGVPRDAKIVGKTWCYVNKSGGPDRRFNNNYQIPVVLYGTLELSAPSGLRLSLQTSSDGLAAGSVELLRVIQAAVRELEARQAGDFRLEPLPGFADDPPPLFLPGLKAARGLLNLLTFHWLAALPEWASLAVWGLLFALAPVSLIIWFARGGMPASVFLCAAFTVTGAGAGRLGYEQLRRRREQRVEETAAARSRFRALLAGEFKSHPLDQVNFSDVLAGSGISRREADLVADEVYRKVADRFAQDGVIAGREQAKLHVLAKALEIDPARAQRIESEAKAVRYRQAVSEALADGTVTEEEARVLNRLRLQLGVEDSAWTAGDLLPRD